MVFLETLLLNLKNEVVSYQIFTRKARDEKKRWLLSNIAVLKTSFLDNQAQILRLETDLNKIIDLEIRSELEKNRAYDILNTEKMTPRFLSLCKANKKMCSLDSIRDVNGEAFSSERDRDTHITSFFQNIYTPAQGNTVLGNDCIQNFLGPEICNNEIVLNAKLTVQEKNLFDTNLSIQELDSALAKLNENSAGGLDGIPTKFLKTFWGFLRIPLHKYTIHAFETGNLSQSFNSAGIKLIPKKGDVTSLKNWRPMSLLNSVFKIISKALDSRLQKLNEIILSRAQKGFTRNRQLHECIINIVEAIAYGQQEQIPAFVLALDMA
jgi:hypothetical protein